MPVFWLCFGTPLNDRQDRGFDPPMWILSVAGNGLINRADKSCSFYLILSVRMAKHSDLQMSLICILIRGAK